MKNADYSKGAAMPASFFKKNEGLIIKAAQGLGSWLERDDIIQAGNLALIQAASHWDKSRGVTFTSYAWRAIRNEVMKAEAKQRWAVAYSFKTDYLARGVYKLGKKLGRAPTLEEVRETYGKLKWFKVSDQIIEAVLAWNLRPAGSLNYVVDEASGTTLQGIVADTHCADDYRKAEQRLDVEGILAEVTPKEAFLLVHRFGLRGQLPKTYAQIGLLVGITRQAIEVRYSRLMAKLQKRKKNPRQW